LGIRSRLSTGSRWATLSGSRWATVDMEHLVALIAHRDDVPLVPDRGRDDPELTGHQIDLDRRAADARIADARDEGLRLCRADANGLRLLARSLVADVDVIVARAQRQASPVADGGVFVAGAVLESLEADSRVVVAGVVEGEREIAAGGVLVAA